MTDNIFPVNGAHLETLGPNNKVRGGSSTSPKVEVLELPLSRL